MRIAKNEAAQLKKKSTKNKPKFTRPFLLGAERWKEFQALAGLLAPACIFCGRSHDFLGETQY
jgi:hypothetical protein